FSRRHRRSGGAGDAKGVAPHRGGALRTFAEGPTRPAPRRRTRPRPARKSRGGGPLPLHGAVADAESDGRRVARRPPPRRPPTGRPEGTRGRALRVALGHNFSRETTVSPPNLPVPGFR